MKFRKENDYTNNNVLGYHCSVNGCLVSELKCVKQKTSTLSVHKDQGSTEAQFQFSTSLCTQFKKMWQIYENFKGTIIRKINILSH